MSAARPESFQRYQLAFTAHIRDPRGNPRPRGVSARRMRVYNELLFNNVESFLLACFPITRKILGARRWRAIAKEFFAVHKCASPLFRQIPEEFVRFLQARELKPKDLAFLAHFAHYEWVELAVDTSPAEVRPDQIDFAGDLLTGYPVLAPAHAFVEYPYPVHRIGPRFQPESPDAEPTRILVFRDPEDKVRFVVMNAVTARLWSLLTRGELTGRQACGQIAAELKHPDPAVVLAGGRDILHGLHQQGAILGTAMHARAGY